MNTKPDWRKGSENLVREIVREGEAFIQGQLNLATSADSRASILGGVFVAAGTALIAGLVAAASAGTSPPAIVVGGLVSAIRFMTAAGLCLSTVLPIGFYLPGNEPESWYEDVDKQRDYVEALGEEAENFQMKIVSNRKSLRANAKRFKWGVIVGIVAPMAGLLVWFAMSIQFRPDAF